MLFKDACNSKSNQKNLGTIKSSNLCTEIIEYTDPDEVCGEGPCDLCLLSSIEVVDQIVPYRNVLRSCHDFRGWRQPSHVSCGRL